MPRAGAAPGAAPGGSTLSLYLLLPAVIAAAAFASLGIHSIHEGHVGMYWRGGAQLDSLSNPGFRWRVPLLDHYAEVQVTMQTDSIENIACGTSGGVMVYFDRIEVVNQLEKAAVLKTVRDYGVNYDKIWIFDKIHHEVNQFCSKHTLHEVYVEKFDTLDEQLQSALQASCTEFSTGIRIMAVRVTKPRIPDEIRQNFEAVEAEKTRLRIATERQQVVLVEAETESRKQKVEADREKMVKEIQMQQQVMEEQKLAEVDAIKSAAEAKRVVARADADTYASERLAAANEKLLTREHLAALLYQSLANNTKVFFGDRIPQMFVDPAASLGLISQFPQA